MQTALEAIDTRSATLTGREQHCPECESTLTEEDYSRGELLCSSCGLVLEDRTLDRGPGRYSGDRESGIRQWGPSRDELLPDFGISTAAIGTKDKTGRMLPASKNAAMHRLRKLDRRAKHREWRSRNLDLALSEISAICSQLGLKETVKREAAMICRRLKEYRLHGRPNEELVVAIVYAASRVVHVPRTLHEVSQVSGLPEKEIGRNYRFITRKLDLDVSNPSPQDYIPRFANELDLSVETTRSAVEMATRLVENEMAIGRDPVGIAAGAIYLASRRNGDRRTQGEISEVAGVSDATIRTASAAIEKLFPPQ